MVRSTLRAAVTTLVCVLGSASVVAATDFCIHEDSGGGGGNTIVLKAFSLPGKGACKEAAGFFEGGPYFMSGSACGSSDGVGIRFVLVSLIADALTSDTFALLRVSPTTAVSGRECDANGGSCANFTYSKTTCSPTKVPVPQQEESTLVREK